MVDHLILADQFANVLIEAPDPTGPDLSESRPACPTLSCYEGMNFIQAALLKSILLRKGLYLANIEHKA